MKKRKWVAAVLGVVMIVTLAIAIMQNSDLASDWMFHQLMVAYRNNDAQMVLHLFYPDLVTAEAVAQHIEETKEYPIEGVSSWKAMSRQVTKDGGYLHVGSHYRVQADDAIFYVHMERKRDSLGSGIQFLQFSWNPYPAAPAAQEPAQDGNNPNFGPPD